MKGELFHTLVNKEAVGRITIKNDELVVGREDQLIHVYINTDRRDDVRVGDYLRIPYETEDDEREKMMFGAVSRLQYRQRTSFDDQQDSGLGRQMGEHNYSYIARIEPIAVVIDTTENEAEDDEQIIYERKTVSMPPRPQSKVFLVDDKVFLQSGLDLPQNGDFAGFLAVAGDKVPSEDDPLPYYFENPEHDTEGEPQFFRHTMVCGDTGMGKTHFSKNILRQYTDGKRFEEEIPFSERDKEGMTDATEPRELNISIIDPENEYIEMADESEEMTDADRELCDKHNITYGGISNDPNVDIEAWQVSVSGNYEITGDRNFYIPFEIVEGRPELLLTSETGEPTQRQISELISRYFSTHNNPSYQEFSQWAEMELDAGTVNNESIEEAVRRRLIDNPTFSKVFDGGGGPSLTDASNEIFERGTVSVFPMRHIKGYTEKLVVMCLLSYIVDNQLSQSADDSYINGTPMLLCVDEAHKYLSEPSNQQEFFIVNKFRDTAKRGRKENFGLYTVTQNPQDIDEEIRQQTNTKIFLGLDANIVESSDVHVPTEYKNRIKEYDKGEAVIVAPGKRPVEVQGLPFCVTAHNK